MVIIFHIPLTYFDICYHPHFFINNKKQKFPIIKKQSPKIKAQTNPKPRIW